MGAKVNNTSGGKDFATNECFIEFHRRVIIPEKAWKQIMPLLDSGEFDAAANILKDAAPQNAHSVIDLFLGSLSEDQKANLDYAFGGQSGVRTSTEAARA